VVIDLPRSNKLILDSHLHLPLKDAEGDVRRATQLLLRELDRAGVVTAIVIAIELDPKRIVDHIDASFLRAAVEPFSYDWKALNHPTLSGIMFDASKVINDYLKVINKHISTTENVVEASKISNGRLLAVASYNPSMTVEENVERLSSHRKDIVGVKLYPTLHFMRPDDPKLDLLYDFMESEGLILIVHTGCDPGIWELPALCATANPRYLEPIARKHRDLTIIAAHMGSYSYLMPGIYFPEAMKLAKDHDNVYLDTSATTLHQVKRALNRVRPEKLLYGSDYPYFSGLGISDILESYLEFRVEDRVKERILGENLEEVLKSLNIKISLRKGEALEHKSMI